MPLPTLRTVRVADDEIDDDVIVASLPGRRTPTHGDVTAATPPDPDPEPVAAGAPVPAATLAADVAHISRILVVAERLAIFAAAVLSGCAMLAARFGGLSVHPLALAAWSSGACLAAVCLAAVATDPTVTQVVTGRRRVVTAALLVTLLGCLTGAVAAADGVAGPAWVLFLPVVVIAGAVGGAVPGLLTGAGATAGTYAAAALGHTLSIAGVGRLVVILPVFPVLGWATGALCGAVTRAARDARVQQAALHADVVALTGLLHAVASGDLAASASTPAPPDPQMPTRSWSDPATEGLAVVLADTLVALRRLVGRLAGAGEQMLGAADELASTAALHVAAVETQSVAVSQTTTTIEQLAATAVVIADTASRVSQSAVASRTDARTGFEAVERASAATQALHLRTEKLAELAQSLEVLVERVSAITKVMDELSRRTSMLALSAAIEAASAHEHSAGFANVAAEVRSLAERAREATGRIDAVVADLRTEIADTARAARQGALAVTVGVSRQHEVEAALGRITDMISHTASAAREIDAATRQQRIAADAVVQAMVSVEAASGQARAATARHNESATTLRDLATGVRDTIARFRLPGVAA